MIAKPENNNLWEEASHRRHESGLTLEAVESVTKISRVFLRAIEMGDFGRLPGGLYDRTYIRQYANQIHFDEQRLLDAYEGWSAENRPKPEKRQKDPFLPGLSWFSHLLTRR